MKGRVILFDDNISNLDLYGNYLSEDFECHNFLNPYDFEKALNLNPDIIILDMNMPFLTGPEVYQKMVEHPAYNGCPILFISASTSDETLLSALQQGGQDFLSRSMGKQEMLYRIRNKVEYFRSNRNIFGLAEVKIDMKALKAYEKDRIVELTLTELKILKELLTNYPQTLTRKDMNEAIWPGLKVQDNTLNTHVSNLRGKFENWSFEILHVKSVGFRLTPKNA